MKILLLLEYDGTAYAGLQLQPNIATIQGELEASLQQVYQTDIRIIASGRTDAGVHAVEQIIHYDAPRDMPELNIIHAINSHLKPDIRIIKAAKVSSDFHARFSARRRDYSYHIHRKPSAINRLYSWYLRDIKDTSLLQNYADQLIGDNDFKSFCSSQAEVDHYLCTVIKSEWESTDGHLLYRISANRFLHSMVRSLVGTMVVYAAKKRAVEEFIYLLEEKKRGPDIFTAPPQGLFLMKVHYEDEINWVSL